MAALTVSCTEPAGQTAPENCLGSTTLPRSPNFAKVVFVNSPWPGVGPGAPPALPHGSKIGALPGARHGLNFVQSSSLPATAPRLMVRVAGSLFVAFMPAPQRSILFGLPGPLAPPSHSLQPMEQPSENLLGQSSRNFNVFH